MVGGNRSPLSRLSAWVHGLGSEALHVAASALANDRAREILGQRKKIRSRRKRLAASASANPLAVNSCGGWI